VGGYLSNWLGPDLPAVFKKGFRVVQDILPTGLSATADVVLPAAAWAEKDGCWENYAGLIQLFEAAIAPPQGTRREGDVYYKLLGRSGQYHAATVRSEMGEPFTSVKPEPTPATTAVEMEFVPI
jgi:anaerobic selenocysteine-containing dehydrogenase